MSNINDVFGDAKLGEGGKTHWFKFPKEGGSLVLRILPSYGSLKASGRWSQYYVTHFGYRDSKGKTRTFESPEVINRQNRMVEVADPAMERIKALRSAQEKAKIENNTEMVKKIGEQLRVFNAKKAHYMNVIDLDGKIGVLSIPHKMKMALDTKIKELQQKGINPLAAQGGRFFVFTRTGSGVNTTHMVDVYRDPSTDQQVVSNLTAEIASRMTSEGVDLATLYVKPTPEEVSEIVKSNGGTVLESILSRYRKNSKESAGLEEVYEDDEYSQEAPPATASAPAATVLAAAEKQAETSAEANAATTKDISQMSNEEFLKSLGV
jgi:hypothetical protein